MPPPSFSEVFGGSNIYPSQATYLPLDPLTANVVLEWPIEQAISGQLIVASIIDVNPTAPGLHIQFPDARQSSEGFTALINNIGANTVDVLASDGSTIVSIVSGTVWQIYLTDNTTQAGTWRIFQFGASVSVAVAAALAGSGLKAIGATLNEKMTVAPRNSTPYNIVSADRANVQQWIGGVGSFILPDPATVGADWFTVAKNQGSGNLTLSTVAGNIDGNATLVLAPGQSAWILTDGANYFSLVGAGSSGSGSGFNLITIDVSGTGNFPLTGGELNQIGYKFIGVLTGNRDIIVPNTIQEYWVDNETSGAFTLQVQTAGQVAPAPPVIAQGTRNILYCDGTNVVSAESASISFPISVAQGGTSATTAATARTNLGSTAVGDAVFTAVSQAAAQATLNVPPNTRLINTTSPLAGGGDLSVDRTISINTTTLFAQLRGGVEKPAITNRATNVRSADPDLTFAGLAAGTYIVEGCLAVKTSGGTQGLGFNLSGANMSVGLGGALQMIVPSNVNTFTGTTSAVNIGLSYTTGAFPEAALWFKAFVTLTNTSDITLQWAQGSAGGTATGLDEGSFMTFLKVA